MPKLPVVSGSEAVKAFFRLGFVAARQRGSHVVMKGHDRTFSVPPPRNSTVAPCAILRGAGVSVEEFLNAL